MNRARFVKAVSLIDTANASDPDWETWQGKPYPKTFLYGLRMTEWLLQLNPKPPETAFLAARAQHTCRWLVPRDHYPRDRKGYLEWRTFLYRLHAEKAAQLLHQAGYEEAFIHQVKRILMKRSMNRDPQVQLVEDAACLVFLHYYFASFANQYDEDKLIDIVRKTWKKMSEKARLAALNLGFDRECAQLVQKALVAK
ncbi:MAG: hypothetical protein AXA67_08030 [Methylothermaceae bacteria B42]|nr:MAG: hypothetical protein AXA67_08030 [Methylothermaceae bacteria B42]HHJ40441.1 DUF4202 domain-containing protein [Methylothermaceae bacterium]